MSTTESLELAGVRLGAPVATVDDAIRQDAALAAVETVVGARRKALKAWAGERLGRPGARVELADVGVALLTDPKPKPVIVDGDAFLAWALIEHPDRTDTVERLNPVAIEAALRGDHGDELRDRLVDLFDEIPGATTTEVVVEEKLAADVAKPSVARELEDGRLVVKATGDIIPGVEIRMASTAAPRLTPDKALVDRLVGEITGRLAPVTTTEESTA